MQQPDAGRWRRGHADAAASVVGSAAATASASVSGWGLSDWLDDVGVSVATERPHFANLVGHRTTDEAIGAAVAAVTGTAAAAHGCRTVRPAAAGASKQLKKEAEASLESSFLQPWRISAPAQTA